MNHQKAEMAMAGNQMPDPRAMLLARIAHATGADLMEIRGRELADTPGLTAVDRRIVEHAIEVRFAELNARDGMVFHVEKMGECGGLFGALGRALQREEKHASDFAHAEALAEELARLLRLKGVELRQDAAGVVVAEWTDDGTQRGRYAEATNATETRTRPSLK